MPHHPIYTKHSQATKLSTYMGIAAHRVYNKSNEQNNEITRLGSPTRKLGKLRSTWCRVRHWHRTRLQDCQSYVGEGDDDLEDDQRRTHQMGGV